MVTVESYHSLAQAEPTWRKFVDDGVCLPYQAFDLVNAWHATLDEVAGAELCLLAVYDHDGSPLLFLPFGAFDERGLGMHWKVIRLLPGPDTADQMAPVLAGRAGELGGREAQAMWREILRSLPKADTLRLENMPTSVCGVPNPLLHAGVPFHYQKDANLTELQPDWEAYCSSKMSKSRRSNSRRLLRRLAEVGSVEFRAVEDPDERARVVETLVCQKRRWVAGNDLRDGFAMDNYPEFYQELVRSSQSMVRIAMLTVDDEIIATDFCLAADQVLYGLKNSNAGGKWQSYAPGVLLMEWVLQRGIEDGFKFMNFGVAVADYIKKWCELSEPLYLAEVHLSARARLASVPRMAKRQLEQTVRRRRAASGPAAALAESDR